MIIIEEKKRLKKTKRNKQQQIAKSKYNKDNYSSLQVHLDKDLVMQFKSFVKQHGLKQSEIIRFFVVEFMKDSEKYITLIKNSAVTKIDFLEKSHKSDMQHIISYFDKMKSEEEIIKYFLTSNKYTSRRELLPLSEYLGFNFEKKTPRFEIVYAIQCYFTDRLKNKQIKK